MASYFHKKCNPTIRKFFEDFDRLPYEIKEILWDQPHPPTFEDLTAAWKLVEETGLKADVHVLRAEKKKQKAEARKLKRALEKQTRQQKWRDRWNRGARTLYKKVRIDRRGDKHRSLVRLFSEEELMEAVATRKREGDLQDVSGYVYRPVGRVLPTETQEEGREYFQNDRPPQSITKMMHNSVGKSEDSPIKKLAGLEKEEKN